MQARWKMVQEADVAERLHRLQVIREVVAGKLGDESTLRVLRETSAIRSLVKLERWTIQSISKLESLIYAVCDAHVAIDSPLWRGELAPESMRLATAEEVADYGGLSTPSKPSAAAAMRRDDAVTLPSGERLLPEDAESQAALNFVRHYLQPESDAPDAINDFYRDMRIRDQYAERSELALESAFNLLSIAKDFSHVLMRAQHAADTDQRMRWTDLADDLLVEFNMQRYGLFQLLKSSHVVHNPHHRDDDKQWVQQFSRDVLMHALAEKSYELPTMHEVRAMDFQSEHRPTVESYFNEAYAHLERVLAIRPQRHRLIEVPMIDAATLDTPVMGRLH